MLHKWHVSSVGRLIVSAQVTVDGVMDQLEGWFDAEVESSQYGREQLRAVVTLVLGRETYEFLSTIWPRAKGPYAELIDPMPKYVASRTLREPLTWNARLLRGDAAEAVSALKEHINGELISYGRGQLANYLALRGFVDEVRLWLHPVVWGDGSQRSGGRPMAPLRDGLLKPCRSKAPTCI